MDKKFLPAALAVTFGVGLSFAQTAEIGTWAGFRKGAASFTFDDGAPSHVSDGGPLFDKYGYKGTFNVVVNWNPDWSGFGNMAKNGHEIASHSNTHGQNMSGEEASSKKSIEGKIQQKYGVITVAYPNCNVPNKSAVQQNYVIGRICNGSWQSQPDMMSKDGPSDWTMASAIMTGSTGTNDFKGNMQKAVQQGGWIAFLTHGFENKNNGSATYSPTPLSAIEDGLKWAQQNDKDIWVAPMGHVAMYIKERKASKVEASGSGTITVKLTHNIADNVSKYDYPLSIRVKYDGSQAEVTQAGAKLESKIDGGYVYFDAVPNAGDIVISGGATTPSSSSEVTSSSSVASSSSTVPPQSSSSGFGPWPPLSSSSTTAIAAEPAGLAAVAVYRTADNYIEVSGAQGMAITVYNNLGQVIRTTRSLGIVQKVYTGAKGMYIVKVGSRTFKISL
ncbi:polysaccharide deacetylase family protein [Fibrobacter sp. UWR2]|uniref:polysaccharide deacetylase family protein n=1 Tax=Fibrobacter sp. UWR2 TaxID=1964352 RepID=UPI000B527D53|nr:polysaccharide deacetylase family protein [Fibrobacter sp. UWR2]OWU99505.1 polysaccharide deacetylase [Fibrobacter sp. UWR2]